MIYQLGLSEPPVKVSIAKEMLDYNETRVQREDDPDVDRALAVRRG